MRPRQFAIWFLPFLFLVLGCEGGGLPSGDVDAKLPDTFGPKDSAQDDGSSHVDITYDIPPDTSDTSDLTPTDTDELPPTDLKDTKDADTDQDPLLPDGEDDGEVVVEEGSFGWPCEDWSDCIDEFCVQTDDGKICSKACRNDCPADFECKAVQDHSGQPVFRCVPRFLNFCRPCRTDLDCRVGAYPMGGLVCLPWGGEVGSYCLPGCVKHEDCPSGAQCLPPPVDMGERQFCVPVEGECGCSPFAIESGASTDCSLMTHGLPWACGGIRTCEADGLGECTGRLPSVEKCNGIDDNCNGLTDEEGALDCTTYYLDMDMDGVGLSDQSRCLCAPYGRFSATVGGDCNDKNPQISPKAREICNYQDDNCNGLTDEEGAHGCQNYYLDVDGDGFGDSSKVKCLCRPEGNYRATNGGDCDDNDSNVFPGAFEWCNGKDDNCDGRTDEDGAIGCQVYYLDEDGDGFGLASASLCKCQPDDRYRATRIGDCNDRDPTVHPGALEVCNGKDDDCDMQIDPPGVQGCIVYMRDEDGDGFGISGDAQCLCLPGDIYRATVGGDCDDSNNAVYPGAVEKCNDVDDDCNGVTDDPDAQGCELWFADADMDGYGGQGACLCGPTFMYSVQTPGDCDDDNPMVNPGVSEVCGNGIDDNCNGETDEPGCEGCSNYYFDNDGDGWGIATDFMCLEAPDVAAKYTAMLPGDCDDANPSINPGQPELCGNGIDDNCDGKTDDENAQGCTTYYMDWDNDGFGDDLNFKCLCAASGRYRATKGGDCNDRDRLIHPNAREICNDRDDNCDGFIDPPDSSGCTVYFKDEDGDGYGLANDSLCLCNPSGFYRTTIAGDCDDTDAGVRPGGTERCNGKDDNCDGRTDEAGAVGCQSHYLDIDGDGFGIDDGRCLCGPDGMYRALQLGDCDDSLDTVYPGAIEVCNGIDDNCDGETDEPLSQGCQIYYFDGDRDGFGQSGTGRCLCGPSGYYTALVDGDCDDNEPLVGAGSVEVCNGLDDDCNGLTDEPGALGCTTYYLDRDGDGFGVDGSGRCLCEPEGNYTATVAGDCNDGDPQVFPGQVERCNGRDDNCDELIDEEGSVGCINYYLDVDGDAFGVDGDFRCLCRPDGMYRALVAGDCDDSNASVNEEALEICNGIDDNCDGITDPPGTWGCTVYYRDVDEDGYGTDESQCLCEPDGEYTATIKGDCAPNDPSINPGMPEICNGKDDNCDGKTDPDGSQGCVVRYRDSDGDGWGVQSDSRCVCNPKHPYTASRYGDCDDDDPEVYPGAVERCNGKDDNCDGIGDPENAPGCTRYYRDKDRDGFGAPWGSKCLCAPAPPYDSTNGDDCNDDDPKVNPAALEVCNGIDDDCDGLTDPDNTSDCKVFYRDNDGDGYGDSSHSICACKSRSNYTSSKGGDCCDDDYRVFPGQKSFFSAASFCGGYDFNCDGVEDKQDTSRYAGCDSWPSCGARIGWAASASPSCGVQATYVTGGCGWGLFGCDKANTQQRRQACR